MKKGRTNDFLFVRKVQLQGRRRGTCLECSETPALRELLFVKYEVQFQGGNETFRSVLRNFKTEIL
jgi:hypothetical protein